MFDARFHPKEHKYLVKSEPSTLPEIDAFAALDAARADFDRRIRLVGPSDFDKATPCEGWVVRDLLEHVVRGNLMAAKLSDGASKDEVMALFQTDALGDDVVAAWETSADAQDAGLRTPGVLEMTVHHPAFEMPGAQLLAFRTGDLLLHSWDLARSIGADDSLDEGCAAHMYEALAPMAEMMPSTGQFGSGPSGSVGEDAPIAQRLLDLTGRRP